MYNKSDSNIANVLEYGFGPPAAYLVNEASVGTAPIQLDSAQTHAFTPTPHSATPHSLLVTADPLVPQHPPSFVSTDPHGHLHVVPNNAQPIALPPGLPINHATHLARASPLLDPRPSLNYATHAIATSTLRAPAKLEAPYQGFVLMPHWNLRDTIAFHHNDPRIRDYTQPTEAQLETRFSHAETQYLVGLLKYFEGDDYWGGVLVLNELREGEIIERNHDSTVSFRLPKVENALIHARDYFPASIFGTI